MCELVKVMFEKFDHRSGERNMRTQILRRFVIKSPPTDVLVYNPLGQFRRRRRRRRWSSNATSSIIKHIFLFRRILAHQKLSACAVNNDRARALSAPRVWRDPSAIIILLRGRNEYSPVPCRGGRTRIT